MPNAMREGLLGLADLLSGTETGELTGCGAAAFTMGGLGAGGTMAPRGALAAGGAKAPLPDSLAIPDFLKRKPAMPPVVNVARATDSGFLPNQRLYHWTDAPDFPAFAYGSSRARSLGLPQAGFGAAEDPKYLEDMARLVGRPDGTGSRVIPLVPRYSNHASVTLQPGFTHQDIALNIPKLWGDGYDAIRFTNYNTFADGTATPTWVFRHPNQLRSPFARFDPAKHDSSDLMAGYAVPAPAAVPGFNVQAPQPPGFNLDPAEEGWRVRQYLRARGLNVIEPDDPAAKQRTIQYLRERSQEA